MPETATAQKAPAAGDGHVVNPLREGLESDRITDPCTIVFFGASGDLFKRMLLPALYNLRLGDILPSGFAIVGYSRTKFSDQQFRDYCKLSVDQFSRSGAAKEPMWSDFSERISYITGEFTDTSDYRQLQQKFAENEKKFGTKGNVLFYLATPPQVFPTIVAQIKSAGLDPPSNTKGWTRIIIEKPFGTDLASARSLQAEVEKVFDESQVYRIDHYLGKEPVQDIMALRFANMIFEPIWNRRYIDGVQITAAETLGVELRGAYYDHAGTLRDMIQNHVINLLALVAMEPPVSGDADAIRNEKFKVLSAIEPIASDEVFQRTARGQYGPGVIDGKPVAAYRSEKDVAPDSNTETYAAVELYIDNWRWAGVPFYLRSGKRLARKISEIAVRFSAIPHRLFGERSDEIEANVLVMKIEPDEGVTLRFNAKVPGPKNHIRGVNMDFNYGTGFGIESSPAYERLIGDAIRGDATLFTRWDAVQRAWQIVTPILETWQATTDSSFPNYAAGGQGPPSADRLLAADGHAWRRI